MKNCTLPHEPIYLIKDENDVKLACQYGENVPIKLPCLWVGDGEECSKYNIYAYEEDVSVMKEFIKLIERAKP